MCPTLTFPRHDAGCRLRRATGSSRRFHALPARIPASDLGWTGEGDVLSPASSARAFTSSVWSTRCGANDVLWETKLNETSERVDLLHLRGFTGRPGAIGSHVAAHAINPALQPRWPHSCRRWRAKATEAHSYCYTSAFREPHVPWRVPIWPTCWSDLHPCRTAASIDSARIAIVTYCDRRPSDGRRGRVLPGADTLTKVEMRDPGSVPPPPPPPSSSLPPPPPPPPSSSCSIQIGTSPNLE